MPDNVTLPGSGSIIATDEIGVVQYPRTKISLGADGVFDGDVSTANPMPVIERATVLIGAAAQTAVVNNILSDPAGAASTAIENYRSATIQVVSTGTGGTFIFEQSNDNVSWQPLPVFNAGLATAVPIIAAITATASSIMYVVPLRGRFLRLRIATTITGGSIRAFARLSSEPFTPAVTSIAQATAGNLQVTATGTVTSNFSIPNGTIINSAATTNGTVIQAGATSMMNLTAFNSGAAVCFLKLHNSATVTPGTTAVAMTIPLPPGALTQVDCGVLGMRFSTGLCISITNLVADNDTTAIAAGQVKVHIGRF